MDKRSMFLGAGFGIIIVTFVFFIGLRLDKPEAAIQTVTEPMSSEQIIEQARKLGMVMVKELPAASADSSAGTQSADKAEYEAMEKKVKELERKFNEAQLELQMNMAALAEANTQLQERNALSPPAANAPVASAAPVQPASAPPSPAPAQTPEPSQAPVYYTGNSADMGDFMRVTIPSGGNSITISSLLSNSGVVEDAGNFNTFVIENGKSTKLIAGTYDIPKDATYDEVLDIITKANVDEP